MVDVEHSCGGSRATDFRRLAAGPAGTAVKAEDVARLLVRALHRITDIKHIYVSKGHTEVSLRHAKCMSCVRCLWMLSVFSASPTYTIDELLPSDTR